MTPDILKLSQLARLVLDWQMQTDRLHDREAGRLPSPALCQAAADTAYALQKIRCFDARDALGQSRPMPTGAPTMRLSTDRRTETPQQYRARVGPEWRCARRKDDPAAVLTVDRHGDLQPAPLGRPTPNPDDPFFGPPQRASGPPNPDGRIVQQAPTPSGLPLHRVFLLDELETAAKTRPLPDGTWAYEVADLLRRAADALREQPPQPHPGVPMVEPDSGGRRAAPASVAGHPASAALVQLRDDLRQALLKNCLLGHGRLDHGVPRHAVHVIESRLTTAIEKLTR